MMLEIIQAVTDDRVQQVRELSRIYVRWLEDNEKALDLYDPQFFQDYGYKDGVAELPANYAPPDGCLLLALYDSLPVGCVALAKYGDGICELRMLFVRPECQGKGVGKALVNLLVDSAQKIGYDLMRLETSAYMTDACRLYHALGFHDIEPYYDVQHSMKALAVFMEKSL